MPNQTAVDLEVGLRHDSTGYTVELRYDSGDGIAILPAPNIKFDFAELRKLAYDPAAYGQSLTNSLFGDEGIKEAFKAVCVRADATQADVRLRLLISPTAVDLHQLRWETLRDPREKKGDWLVTSERILFSRYLSSRGYFSGKGWREVAPRTRADLRPLVMIANPTDIEEYEPGNVRLTTIPVADESRRVKEALAGLEVTEFASGGSATLEHLVDAVRDGCNLVYLVCHGALIEKEGATGKAGEPHLWLEKTDGSAAVTPGSELIGRLGALPQVPRLVVLASCQSGGKGDGPDHDPNADAGDRFLKTLGPQLSEIGVPAVVAMQGDVSMQTVAEFMPKFFAELQKDGQVDRAMAVARGAVHKQPDSWKPMLFMRLRTGRIWTLSSSDLPKDYKRWPSLVMELEDNTCVPILGPGTYETLAGSRREIARRWAQENHFPMGADSSDDLARVAQYLAVTQTPDYLLGSFQKTLADEIKQRYGKILPPELQTAPRQKLLEILKAVGAWQRKEDPNDLYRLLAGLPCPLYVTTNPSSRLYDALLAIGKHPAYATQPWRNDETEWPHSKPGTANGAKDGTGRTTDLDDPDYTPDTDHPLIYHVFGHFDNMRSLVLSEDNIFDYLTGVTWYDIQDNKGGEVPVGTTIDPNPSELRYIRGKVSGALASSSLLFLGFPIDDWTFRVLLRTILKQPGSRMRDRKPKLAVQVDPDDDRIENADAAKKYFTEYFDANGEIEVIWSGVEEFVKQLHDAVATPASTTEGSP